MQLSDATEKRIVKLYRDKLGPMTIGEREGISGSTVRRVLLRRGVKMRGPGRPRSKKA